MPTLTASGARVGRPPRDERQTIRDRRVSVRVTEAQREALAELAEARGLTTAELVREHLADLIEIKTAST